MEPGARLVVMASGNGSNAQAVIEACSRGEIHATRHQVKVSPSAKQGNDAREGTYYAKRLAQSRCFASLPVWARLRITTPIVFRSEEKTHDWTSAPVVRECCPSGSAPSISPRLRRISRREIVKPCKCQLQARLWGSTFGREECCAQGADHRKSSGSRSAMGTDQLRFLESIAFH